MKNEKQTMKVEETKVIDTAPTAQAAVVKVDTSLPLMVKAANPVTSYPYLRLGQPMSQFRIDGRAPTVGGLYVRDAAGNYMLIGEPGHANGITGIILDAAYGYMEDKPYVPGQTTSAPRRYLIVGDETEKSVLERAQADGLSLTPVDTGRVWPDSGRPILKATLSPTVILAMLVRLPDEFDSDMFDLIPIGDHMYTPIRYEANKQYFRPVAAVLANIRQRQAFVHRGEKDFVPTLRGVTGHIYSTELRSKSGIAYQALQFERAVVDGKPWTLSESEASDFDKYVGSVTAGVGLMKDVAADDELLPF